MPKVFKGLMCHSTNEIQMKQVLIFMDLELFFMDSGLMHALPFSVQRSPTSTSLCTLENHRRGGDRCKGLTEKSMFFLSWLTARGSGMGSACLITDTDSPGKTRGERWTTHVPSPASAHPCPKPASHTPQCSRAALCHQTIQTSTTGMSNPTCHTGKPQACVLQEGYPSTGHISPMP